jgi:hypothetical protein
MTHSDLGRLEDKTAEKGRVQRSGEQDSKPLEDFQSTDPINSSKAARNAEPRRTQAEQEFDPFDEGNFPV